MKIMENKKNRIGFTLFIILLLIIGVGGYFGTEYIINNDFSKVESEDEEYVTNYKINADKDYVYYENLNRVLSYLEIDYLDVYVNLTVANSINSKLNSEMKEYRNSITFIKDKEIPEGTTYESNDEGIYSLTYREYESFNYGNYISLVAKDTYYDVINLNKPFKIQGFVFDKVNNLVLSEEELLNKYSLSIDNIKEQIKTKLTARQEEVDGVKTIDIDTTLNEFDYALFINKIGKLEISYIVKSTNQNYYDNIVLS